MISEIMDQDRDTASESASAIDRVDSTLVDRVNSAVSDKDKDSNPRKSVDKAALQRVASIEKPEEVQVKLQAAEEETKGVRYRDFLEGVAVRRIAQNSAAIREAFRTFDPDGKGYITRNDIRSMLADQLIPDEQAKDLMDQCDKTGDGLVDYEDFARVFGKELAHGPVVSPTQSERASSVRSQAGSDDEDNGSEERDKLAELPETKRGEDDLHDPMQFSTSLAGSSELDRSEIDDDTDGVNRVVSMSNEAFKI